MVLEQIGRYQIKQKLGKGGMATVFRAYDPRFERDVAIKILPRVFMNDELFRARFTREAKTIATLEHGAIVPVYDFGKEDGQPYIVMRLMSGGSLANKLKKGRFSIKEALSVIEQLAPALDVAHQHGIIHRDMKPANILFDQYGNACLSDFGIARVTQASHTLTGENILGTPAYMSPEQVHGDKDLDGRCDLYALGIIFYQMLLGRVPYQATTPAKVMMMHVLDPIPDLSTTGLDLPRMIELWFEKAIAKEPEDRFATATEMLDALKTALQGQEHPTLHVSQKKVKPTPADMTVIHQPAVGDVKPKRGKNLLRIGAIIIGGMAILAVLLVGIAGWQGRGPLSMLAPASPTDNVSHPLTEVIASQTTSPQLIVSVPSSTPTTSPPAFTTVPATSMQDSIIPSKTPEPTEAASITSIGGADIIAFLNANDVWLINVDGNNLRQLTIDGAEKHDLSWDPNGETLYFISGKCIWSVEIEDGRLDFLACLETARSVDAFAVSPDREQVAISLNQELFLVPFDIERLNQARYTRHLQEMSDCEAFSPWEYTKGNSASVKDVHWSQTGNLLSVMNMAPVGGVQADIVTILDIGDCNTEPDPVDMFPAGRFTIDNYQTSPYLQNFSHDGVFLYAVTSFIRNDGYGDLYIYNAELYKGDEKVNPIDGKCCYRDPEFSPDGRYLVFAYQPFEIGSTAQLYYISYGTIGSGAHYTPIPLPVDFFSDLRSKPEPALRPVGGMQ